MIRRKAMTSCLVPWLFTRFCVVQNQSCCFHFIIVYYVCAFFHTFLDCCCLFKTHSDVSDVLSDPCGFSMSFFFIAYHISRCSLMDNLLLTRDVLILKRVFSALYRYNPDEKRSNEFLLSAVNYLSAYFHENASNYKNNKFKIKIKNILMNNTKLLFQFCFV